MSTSLSTIRSNLAVRLRDTSNNIWSAAEMNEAINAALRDAYPAWFSENRSTPTGSDYLVVCGGKLEYDLPVSMRRLLGVDLEMCDEYFTGRVTNTTSSSMTDSSASWEADQFISSGPRYPYDVVIYTGTGAGQYAQIQGNNSTTLELGTTGRYWTGAADSSDTMYMIKNVESRTRDWRGIWAFYVDVEENPTKLYLTCPYIAGMYLRLHYLTAPSEMSSDSDTTDVPQEWIIRQAMAHLYTWRMGNAPGHEIAPYAELAAIFQGLADEYRRKHMMRFPSPTIRVERETDFRWIPDEYPF